MEVRHAYCSAVDHMVPVVLRAHRERADPEAARDRMAVADPADLYCLDYKVRCSGWCCPLFSTSDEPLGDDRPEDHPDAGRPRRWSRRT